VVVVALFAAFVAVAFADVWLGMTVFNAVFRSDGSGGLFWAAVVLLFGLLLATLWLTTKAIRRLRRLDMAKPS
jgi:hypothetical protein